MQTVAWSVRATFALGDSDGDDDERRETLWDPSLKSKVAKFIRDSRYAKSSQRGWDDLLKTTKERFREASMNGDADAARAQSSSERAKLAVRRLTRPRQRGPTSARVLHVEADGAGSAGRGVNGGHRDVLVEDLDLPAPLEGADDGGGAAGARVGEVSDERRQAARSKPSDLARREAEASAMLSSAAKRAERVSLYLFLVTSRRMPTANAEGWIESEGGVGKVSVRRVFRYLQIDMGPRRSPSACAEKLLKIGESRTGGVAAADVEQRRGERRRRRRAAAAVPQQAAGAAGGTPRGHGVEPAACHREERPAGTRVQHISYYNILVL